MKRKSENKSRLQPYSINKQVLYLKRLIEKEKLSIFLGAGISCSCGLPNWENLLKFLKNELINHGINIDNTCENEISNLAKQVFDDKFNSVVANCLYQNGVTLSKSVIAVANLGVRNIVCFNFDDILEETLQIEGVSHQVILNGEKFNINKNDVTVFHPHGYLGRFDTDEEHKNNQIILTNQDYGDLYSDHYCLTNLIQLSLLITNPVLFVGMSLTDPNTIRLLQEARRIGVWHWHYALMKIENNEKTIEQTKHLRNLGVDPVWYRDHSEIPIILQKISKIYP